MSGINRIAKLLHLSPQAAVQYCEKVRRLSHFGSNLRYTTIAQVMERNWGSSLTAQKVAKLVRRQSKPASKTNRAKTRSSRILLGKERNTRVIDHRSQSHLHPCPRM